MKLKLKLFTLILFLGVNSYGVSVIVAKKDIAYNETISTKNLTLRNVERVKKSCTPVTLKYLESGKFIAKHYIKRGFILCEKSLKNYRNEAVLFDFGAIEIEKSGRLLNETDDYIIIKKPNGKTEKIYKDGRVR